MNPKEIEEASGVYEYQFQAMDYTTTTAAKAQYEQGLTYDRLTDIIELLRRNEVEKAAAHMAYLIKKAKELYQSGVISRSEIARKLKDIGIEELDICSLLEKWDNGDR